MGFKHLLPEHVALMVASFDGDRQPAAVLLVELILVAVGREREVPAQRTSSRHQADR